MSLLMRRLVREKVSSMDFLGNILGHHEAMRANEEVFGPTNEHKSSLTHELIAGAAGFEAMKSYEKYLRELGEKPSYSLMKEILAGLAVAEVDKLIKTKGLDEIDAVKARRMATQVAHKIAEEKYCDTTGP